MRAFLTRRRRLAIGVCVGKVIRTTFAPVIRATSKKIGKDIPDFSVTHASTFKSVTTLIHLLNTQLSAKQRHVPNSTTVFENRPLQIMAYKKNIRSVSANSLVIMHMTSNNTRTPRSTSFER